MPNIYDENNSLTINNDTTIGTDRNNLLTIYAVPNYVNRVNLRYCRNAVTQTCNNGVTTVITYPDLIYESGAGYTWDDTVFTNTSGYTKYYYVRAFQTRSTHDSRLTLYAVVRCPNNYKFQTYFFQDSGSNLEMGWYSSGRYDLFNHIQIIEIS
jgi:hypothetical protein